VRHLGRRGRKLAARLAIERAGGDRADRRVRRQVGARHALEHRARLRVELHRSRFSIAC
jgi:hypothetical protein